MFAERQSEFVEGVEMQRETGLDLNAVATLIAIG
jgi:hypothetical protein